MRNILGRFRISLFALAASLSAAPAFAQAPVDFDNGIDVKAVLAGFPGNIRVARDCKKINFTPGGPSLSQPQELLSLTYVEECERLPYPGGRRCRERVAFRDQRTIQVEIKDRELPGVAETFLVCLAGRDLSFKTLSSPHKYQVSEANGLFTLVRQ